MPANEYLAWAIGGTPNVENATDFAADTDLATGFQDGIARSAPANTLWRQHSVAVRALAQMIVDATGLDMHDDGDVTAFKTRLQTSIASVAGTLTAASIAQIWAGADNAHFVTALGLKGAMAAQTLTDASTIAWNMNLGFRAKVILGGNRTLGTPTNLQEGATFTLQAIQDGTGGRTLAYAGAWDFSKAGVPTLSSGPGKVDIIRGEVIDAVAPVLRASIELAA